MPSCASCSHAYRLPIYRNTVCESCGKELKSCRNCRHFSPGSPNDCREPVAEPVIDKNRANFCDWFSPAEDAGTGGKAGMDAARAALAHLFGDD